MKSAGTESKSSSESPSQSSSSSLSYHSLLSYGTEEDLLLAVLALPMLVVDFLLHRSLQLGPLLLLSGLARRAVTPVERVVPVVNVYLLLMQCGGPFPVFTPRSATSLF